MSEVPLHDLMNLSDWLENERSVYTEANAYYLNEPKHKAYIGNLDMAIEKIKKLIIQAALDYVDSLNCGSN